VIKYFIKKTIYSFSILFGVIVLIFFLFNILPGDPTKMLIGQRADVATIENIKKDIGLDKPLYKRFMLYINDVSILSIHNNNPNSSIFLNNNKYNYFKILSIKGKYIVLKYPYLQRSYQTNKTVTQIISDTFPNTLILSLFSIIIAILIGIPAGIIAALKKDTFIDNIILVVSVFGMALPSFFAAILIAWFFAFYLGAYTGLNMSGSLFIIDEMGNGQYLELKNIILPAITLGIRPLAVIIELTRASFLDEMTKNYVLTAKAKGLGHYLIVFKHVLINALNPIITAISGWFASMLGGAVFIEFIFDWKGIGKIIVDSLEKYDFPVLMGACVFISIIFLLINLLVDFSYIFIDPKLRDS